MRPALILGLLALGGCGSPVACLANRYAPGSPAAQCQTGLRAPGPLLDRDAMSGSTAPVRAPRLETPL